MSRQLTDFPGLELSAPIKVVFFDIDGTLLDKDGRYSPMLQAQIARVRKKGIRTAVASGRPIFAAQYLVEQLGLCDPGVFCTGAYVYSPAEQRLLLSSPLPRVHCLSLIKRLRELDVYYELYTEQHFYFETDTAAHIRAVHGHHLRQQPIRADLEQVALSEPVFKFIIGVDQTADRQLFHTFEIEFPELQFAYANLPGYPQWCFANVIDQSACKRDAFEYLLDHYQVAPENVASFGDSHSDKVFLELAGVGVAMGNACPDVKAVARFTTKAAWEDGVAYALERLIP